VSKKNYERQSDTEYTFTRAAWETLRDTELSYGVRCSLEVVPTAQRGVFYVGIQAWSTNTEEDGRRIACVQGSYPNGRAGTLSAYLFALSNSIAQMCDSVRAEDARQRL
jgi:hypothetical protein